MCTMVCTLKVISTFTGHNLPGSHPWGKFLDKKSAFPPLELHDARAVNERHPCRWLSVKNGLQSHCGRVWGWSLEQKKLRMKSSTAKWLIIYTNTIITDGGSSSMMFNQYNYSSHQLNDVWPTVEWDSVASARWSRSTVASRPRISMTSSTAGPDCTPQCTHSLIHHKPHFHGATTVPNVRTIHNGALHFAFIKTTAYTEQGKGKAGQDDELPLVHGHAQSCVRLTHWNTKQD